MGGRVRTAVLASVLAVISSAPASSQAAFPGQNGKIFFVSKSGSKQQIFSVRPNGSGRVQVTHRVSAPTSPDVSSNGKYLAFVATVSGKQNRIVVCPASGGKNKVITTGTSPAWSRDGKSLAYLAPSGSGGTELRVVTIKTRKSRTVISGGVDLILSPIWSNTGNRIFYSRSIDPGDGSPVDTEIYSNNLSGTDQTVVSPGGSIALLNYLRPDLAPNGDALLAEAVDGSEADYSITEIPSQGGSANNLWSPPDASALRYLAPVYSPDGESFLYVGQDYSQYQYWLQILPLSLADDGNLINLPNSKVFPDPDWAPAVN